LPRQNDFLRPIDIIEIDCDRRLRAKPDVWATILMDTTDNGLASAKGPCREYLEKIADPDKQADIFEDVFAGFSPQK